MSSQSVDVQTGVDIDVEDLPVKDLPVNDPAVEGLSAEGLARRITREVWDYTGGLPGRWVPLMIIQERLALEDETATADAVQLAVERQWLEEFGGQNSIRLTGAGRCIE